LCKCPIYLFHIISLVFKVIFIPVLLSASLFSLLLHIYRLGSEMVTYPYFCVFFYGWSRHWKFFKIEKEDIKITISIYCIFVFAFDQFCKRYNRNAVYVFSVVYFFSIVLIVPLPPWFPPPPLLIDILSIVNGETRWMEEEEVRVSNP